MATLTPAQVRRKQRVREYTYSPDEERSQTRKRKTPNRTNVDVEYMVMRKTDGKWSSPVCFTLPADEAGDDERVSIKRRAEQRGEKTPPDLRSDWRRRNGKRRKKAELFPNQTGGWDDQFELRDHLAHLAEQEIAAATHRK